MSQVFPKSANAWSKASIAGLIVVLGLLGALVHYGNRTGSSHARQAGLQYALIMGVMGFIIPGVDNSAHLGGFAGGYLASLLLDPLKPERINHLVIALVLLVLSVASLAVSVLVPIGV